MSLGFSPEIGVHCGHKSRFLKKVLTSKFLTWLFCAHKKINKYAGYRIYVFYKQWEFSIHCDAAQTGISGTWFCNWNFGVPLVEIYSLLKLVNNTTKCVLTFFCGKGALSRTKFLGQVLVMTAVYWVDLALIAVPVHLNWSGISHNTNIICALMKCAYCEKWQNAGLYLYFTTALCNNDFCTG